jgi:hypothetical protein
MSKRSLLHSLKDQKGFLPFYRARNDFVTGVPYYGHHETSKLRRNQQSL